MAIQSPIAFLSAYLDQSECELYRDDDSQSIVAYIPKRDGWQCQFTLANNSYTTAEVLIRAMGLEPVWN